MKKFLFFIFFFPFVSYSQGIQFDNSLSWQKIKEKAFIENKFIFVDCYATWCGPCRYMSKNIFVKKEVGDLFNTKFVSISVQMDSTKKDSDNVKAWYKDAASIRNAFDVSVYPTYLIFSAEGKLIHRFSGATPEAGQFIAKVKECLYSDNHYSTILDFWKLHVGDSLYLQRAIKMAVAANDYSTASAMGDFYISCIKDTFSKVNLQVYFPLIISSKSKTFALLMKYPGRIDAQLHNFDAERKMIEIVSNENIIPLFGSNLTEVRWLYIKGYIKLLFPLLSDSIVNGPLFDVFSSQVRLLLRGKMDKELMNNKDFLAIKSWLKSRFPDFNANEIMLQEFAHYYWIKKEWDLCARSAYQLLKKYGNNLNDFDLNNVVWDYIFEHCSDKKILRMGIKYLRSSVASNPNGDNNLDTYANMLYKVGEIKKAIQMEDLAVAILTASTQRADDLKEYLDHLGRMKRGEKTWIN